MMNEDNECNRRHISQSHSSQDAHMRQASRFSRTPFNHNQVNHLAMTRMQEIYLIDFEGPNAYCHDLNAWYIDAILLQLIFLAPEGKINMYCKKIGKHPPQTLHDF
eukprot:6290615-Ditylum_brightwellii.AAC.1